MKSKYLLYRSSGVFTLAWLLVGIPAAPAGAMTLIRAGLEDLVTANSTIVVAQVHSATSYWNADASFLLTDVSLTTTQVLKGSAERELTVTLMGGTAGGTTTIIPGAAVLQPDRSYVLFLRNEPLPGTDPVLTVAEHCQGAFDIEERDGGAWALSQAAGEALLPDEDDGGSSTDVPGGALGLSLEELERSISALVEQGEDK